MGERHQMILQSDDGDGMLFRCGTEHCGRMVIIRRSGGYEVVQRGDFFATHVGAKGAVQLDVA